jgi:hypothetical protein
MRIIFGSMQIFFRLTRSNGAPTGARSEFV